jgi:hypothetical protein
MTLPLLIAVAVAADLAAAPAMNPVRPPPAWVAACVSAIETARAEFRRRQGRSIQVKIGTELGVRDDRHGECGHHMIDRVRFELPKPRNKFDLPVYSGSIESRSGIDDLPAKPWTRLEWATGSFSHDRHDAGRTADVSVLNESVADASDFTVVFQHALDTCFASAPASPRSPAPPTDAELRARCHFDAPGVAIEACSDAESAAIALEELCLVEGWSVGEAGIEGRTRPALWRITHLGAAAMPILLRLARSTNAAARAAAATGLGDLQTDAARTELRRLAADQAMADTLDGCIGSRARVSDFAKRALRR